MNPSVDATTTRVDAVRSAQQQWRHDLAALGGRNTLLWHRELPLGTFDLTLAHPGGVAKLLAGGVTLLSELVRERVAFTDARARLGTIRDKTVEMRREHGLTTGFIAVGLATWTLRRAKTLPRAPVLLRRCRIHPLDASHHDYSVELDRDVVFNPVLAHYLRGEVGIDLDPVELAARSLSTGGFNPRATYEELEWLCADMPGFSIGPNMVISTYPWAKLPLVAHLSADLARLAAHDLLAALAGHDTRPATAEPDAARADDLAQELSVLDADHAQRLVIDQVSRGASLVIDTPAGTGATQTVTNMVAAALAQGHTALLVSEERPALDALRRRLAHVGLDDVVLDLPEDPRRARAAIRELAAQLTRVDADEEPAFPEDPLPAWRAAAATLAAHEERLHRRHAPWDQSLAQTQASLARLGALRHPPRSHVRLQPPVLRSLAGDRLAEVTEQLAEAARIGVWQRGRSEDPWFGAVLTDHGSAVRAGEVVGGLVAGGLGRAREQMETVCRAAGLPEPLNLTQWRDRLDLMGRAFETCDVFRPQIYDAPLDDMVSATRARGESSDRPGAVSRSRLRRQLRGLLRPGAPPGDLAARVQAARDERAQWEAIAGRAARPTTPEGWEEAHESFAPIHADLTWLADVLAPIPAGQDLMTTHLDLLLERLLRLDARADRLPVTVLAYALVQPLREAGLGRVVDDLARRGIAADSVPAEVELVFQASLHDHLVGDAAPPTGAGDELATAARTLRRADRDHLARNAARVRRTVHRRLQRVMTAHPGQVTALRRAADGGAHDLRALLAQAGDVVLALRPCLVGSPLVVPATLPDELRVQLVVVEHASRTRTAHAVAAIERGAQTVVCGDSLRPGPSAFSCAVEGTPPEPSPSVSLLEEASAVLPVHAFSTHYRALDQRLVDPLRHLGADDVEGYPGVLRAPRAVLRRVEAEDDLVGHVVGTVLEHARRRPGQSMAVLTDDVVLRDGIRTALSTSLSGRLAGDRAVRLALREEGAETFHLVATERWSGEVRDHVVWVAGPGGQVPPHRVATALAATRRTLTVLSATPLADWPAGPAADAVRDLVWPPSAPESAAPVPTLLADLASRLAAEELVVRHDIGHGRYAVPLGIEDPARPGRLLVAIDTDLQPLPGPPGRDHVRIRPEQLSRLGWTHTRVSSSDLFRDPAREVARLLALVRELSGGPAGR